jgi:hypothetical protein
MLKEKVYVNNPHSSEELQEKSGIQFMLFLYSSFDMCLETCFHDVGYA